MWYLVGCVRGTRGAVVLAPALESVTAGAESEALAHQLSRLFESRAFSVRVAAVEGEGGRRECEVLGAVAGAAARELAGAGVEFVPFMLPASLTVNWPPQPEVDSVFGVDGSLPEPGERFTVHRLGLVSGRGRVAQLVELAAPRL